MATRRSGWRRRSLLAEQHFRNVSRYAEALGIKAGTSDRIPSRQREESNLGTESRAAKFSLLLEPML